MRKWRENLNAKFACTIKSRFNKTRFTVKSRFKIQNIVTQMEIRIKKSQFNVKSQFKKSQHPDGGHSLNRDFTVNCNQCNA